MKQYTVTGMSCAACSSRVEKAVSKVNGVSSCSVNLLTNSMGVEGTADDRAVIAAVVDAGYGASVKSSTGKKHFDGVTAGADTGRKTDSDTEDQWQDKDIKALHQRLWWSLGFMAVLMYFSMGHVMWNWPLPSWFDGNHVAMGLFQMLLTLVILVINQRFFISGIRGILHKAPNMDTLVALGAGAAFVYSTYLLFAMTSAVTSGDDGLVMEYMHEFYFETAGMILTLITVGKTLEARSKGKTTDALKSLMKLAPQTATLIRDEREVNVSIEQVKKGDVFVVRPGENIPVDGVVIDGSTAINESALTGESIPVDKSEGDPVSAATINQSGFIRCEATRVGEDTTLSQIIQMVSDAAATKAPIAKMADKVSGIFVPAVIGIAIFTLVIWIIIGKDIGFALARSMTVLVISCPCALGLATPVAIMVGNGVSAKKGILFKTAVSLEETGKAEIVVLDKTGTVTSGEPRVTDIFPEAPLSAKDLLSVAYALERKSEHPLARAILKKAEEEDILAAEVSDFQALPGNGLSATLDGIPVRGGNQKFISDRSPISEELQYQAECLSGEGKTPLFFSRDNKVIGIIAVADTIKKDSPQAVRDLKDMGIQVVMLTGDNERTARAVASQADVEEVIAEVLPDGKEKVVRNLQEKGKVIMVGDGINDAPALVAADIGIAIGAGTDIAIDAADVVLMKSRLSDVPAAIRISRASLRNIKENLFWAFIYNVIGIPLAAGLFISLFGWQLNPMLGAAAMSLSSFCVVVNALRLNLFDIYGSKRKHRPAKTVIGKTKKETSFEKEKEIMEKTLRIEGMMCGHCEERVKKALESLSEVESAVASHETGTAAVLLKSDISEQALTKAVEDQDYKVISIL